MQIYYTQAYIDPTFSTTDPEAKDVVWHNNGRERCSNYRFNTKQKDQMFCPKCGASLGIDNRQTLTPHRYGISVSASLIFIFSSRSLILYMFQSVDSLAVLAAIFNLYFSSF